MKRIASGSQFEEKIGYSRAVLADNIIYISGTTGTDYNDQSVPDAVEDQCQLALQHIEIALENLGATFENVVRVHYILPNRDDFQACWPLLRAAFGKHAPAATMFEAGLIDPKMKIEIEVTAHLPNA